MGTAGKMARAQEAVNTAGTLSEAQTILDQLVQQEEEVTDIFFMQEQAIEALGGSMRDVVRTRMFITDGAAADDVGRAHKELFGDASPAATMVVVAALLDSQWLVEIEVDAVVP